VPPSESGRFALTVEGDQGAADPQEFAFGIEVTEHFDCTAEPGDLPRERPDALPAQLDLDTAVGTASPMFARSPKIHRQSEMAPGSTAARTSTGVRRRSTSLTISAQASVRLNASGRIAGAPRGGTEVIRSTPVVDVDPATGPIPQGR
jgi:hypothetical protein